MAFCFESTNDFWMIVGIIGIFGIVVGYLVSWLRRPQMWAYILRKISKKNWVLLLLRSRGGQLKWAAVVHEGTIINYGKQTFIPSDEFVNYFGSIACYAFDAEDCSPIIFRMAQANDLDTMKKARDPMRVKNVIMLIKALYETMAQDEKLKIILYAIVGVGVLVLIGAALAYMSYAGQSRIMGFLAQEMASNPCFSGNANLTAQLTSLLR